MSSRSKSCDEDTTDSAVNVPTNEIWVHEFTPESALKFRMQMRHKYAENPDGPIIIYINSPGGHAAALLSMLETMDECPCQKITVAYGQAMSAGAILLSYGDVRMAGRHSRIMIHECLAGVIGTIDDMNNNLYEINRLNKYIMTILAKKCKLAGYEELKAIFRQSDGKDIFMTAEEAKAFNLVDHIGTPVVFLDQRAQVGVNNGPRYEEIVKAKQDNTKKKDGCKCGGSCDKTDSSDKPSKRKKD